MHDLLLSFEIKENELFFTEHALSQVKSRLDCFMAAVIRSPLNQAEKTTVTPSDFVEDKMWKTLHRQIADNIEKTGKLISKTQIDDKYFYIFELVNYGYLISGSERSFSDELLSGLKPVFSHLGKMLALVSVNVQRKEVEENIEGITHLLSKTTDVLIITDKNGYITYVNKAYEKLTEYTPEEVIGKRPSTLVQGPETDQETKERIRKAIIEQKAISEEILNYTKSKRKYWQLITIDPIFDKNGNCIGYIGINKDISERKLIEATLRNSQRSLSSLVANLKESILLEDENRKIVLVNNNFCELFGIPVNPEDLKGADCRNSAEESKHLFNNPEGFVKRIGEILREKKPVLHEELKLASGKYLERDYLPILIDEVSQGHLWKYTDISERKDQEKNLKKREEKYRNIIANMKMGLLETDNSDTIIYVNQQACDMTGYSADEILGRKSAELLVPDEYREIVQEKSTLRLKGVSDTYQARVKLKNGELRWWLTSGGPSYNDKGIQIGTIGISVDITDQKNLEEEMVVARKRAEESSRAKESFLANMSHEIRTPLNAIIGMIREISRESLTTKQNIYLKNAALASQHLLSIVNDILDITKIESGEINLDLQPFSLTEVINDTVSILSPGAHDKMLTITTAISPLLSHSYIGDSNRIRQILINLMNNSVKFTETGSISLECNVINSNSNKHKIQLIISDTGIGMDESFLRIIFDKFSQEDMSGGRKSLGTGLGMAITSKLVKLMNGTISIKSKKGVGTATEINLEIEVSDEKIIKTSNESESFIELKQKRILLVEDNEMNRMVANNSLEYFGLVVTEATNGIEAIEELKKNTFDLILMDLQMPEMGGIEATIAIRQEMKINTPIIALTANAFKAEIDRCTNAGMNDYIIKPFEENALLRAIQKNILLSAKTNPRSEFEDSPLPGPKLYDLSLIIQMSRGNKDFLNKIILVFIEQTPVAVKQIIAAWEAKDFETIKRVAHKIKTNLDNFGIDELKPLIRSIESLADEGLATHELEEKIYKLEKVVNLVIGGLTKEKFQ